MSCRLCLEKSTSKLLEIFDAEGIRLQIADIITKHFWFTPNQNDPEPNNKICHLCWTKLNDFHQFYCFVEDTQKKLTAQEITTDSDDYDDDWESADSSSNQLQDDKEIDNLFFIDTIGNYNNTNSNKRKLEKNTPESTKKRMKICSNVSLNKIKEENPILNKVKEENPIDFKKFDDVKLAQEKKTKEDDEIIAKVVDLRCSICGEKFGTFEEVQSHLYTVHGRRNGYVMCCNKEIYLKRCLLYHAQLHLNPDYLKCKKCKKQYKDNYTFQWHIGHYHECYICGEELKGKKSAKNHMKAHEIKSKWSIKKEPRHCC